MWIKIQRFLQRECPMVSQKLILIGSIISVIYFLVICVHAIRENVIGRETIEKKANYWSEHLYMGHH